jgi:nucleoid-associated protein YgaU
MAGLPEISVAGDGVASDAAASAQGLNAPADSAPPPAADPGLVARAVAKAGAITGISKGDVIRGGIGVPVSVLKNELFSGSHPASPTVPSAPAGPPPAPVAHVPPPSAPVAHVPPPPGPHVPPPGPHVPPPGSHVPPSAPPRPAHIGGGTVTVRPGDSLYEIAGHRLGNPNLYPLIEAANPQAVGPDGLIVPGQVLHIPRLPALPPDTTAQVVQPGESLWEIAGGDLAQVQRIAELNHLPDPSLIQPGQVLIVPQAAL